MTYQVENKVSVKAKVKSALTTAIIFVLIVATFMAGGAFLGGVVSSAECDYIIPTPDEIRILFPDGSYKIITNDCRTSHGTSQGLFIRLQGPHANAAAQAHPNRNINTYRDMVRHYIPYYTRLTLNPAFGYLAWTPLLPNVLVRHPDMRVGYFVWTDVSMNMNWTDPIVTTP